MRRNEAGFVSVIGIGVVVPFLFVLLIVGAELNQFLGIRDGVQQIVDEEARISLSRGFASREIEDRLRGRLTESRPYVTISSVRYSAQASSANQIVAVGEYRGMIGTLGEALLGARMPTIPFAIASRARRADASVLLVIDRTIPSGASACGDSQLRSRITLATRLTSSLRKVGVSTIDVAFTPGEREPVDRLEDATPQSLACGAGESGISRLSGTAQVAGDSLDTAYRVSELVFSISQVQAMEQRTVVMITDASIEQGEKTATTFALLAMEAKRSSVLLKQVGIAVGVEAVGGTFPVKSGEASGSAKYLVVSEEMARDGAVPGVIAHHVNGRTFIAE